MNENPKEPEQGILRSISELVEEMVLEKRAVRKREEDKERSKPSKWNKFWNWWHDDGTSLSTILTTLSIVFGGLWTLNQYIAQERAKVEQQQLEAQLRKQTIIVQFSSDLGDKNKRNSAAYALATLAGKDAVPLLVSHLIDASKSDEDASYRNALGLALSTIGDAAQSPVFDLNRQAARDISHSENPRSENLRVISATQPIILHFLKNDAKRLADNKVDFSGIYLQDISLAYYKLDNLTLGSITILDGNFCQASLANVILKGAKLQRVNLWSSVLTGANLSEADLRNSYLSDANLDKVMAVSSNFHSARLERASMIQGNFAISNFSDADLGGADMTKTDLGGADFSRATLGGAKLAGSRLTATDFRGADLQATDMTNTDLEGTKFFSRPDDVPNQQFSYGAHVIYAKFDNARNIDNQTRVYLCKWGALNVPGGCDDVTVLEKDSGSGGGATGSLGDNCQ